MSWAERLAVAVLADDEAPDELLAAAWRFVCLGDPGPMMQLVAAELVAVVGTAA